MTKQTDLLRQVSIFKGLDDHAIAVLSASLRPLAFGKDGLIVSQDDQGDALYIIESGRVKVVLYGESGREMILTMFRAGDFFGEMSLLDGQPRSANVIAMEEAHLLVLSRDDFLRSLSEVPTVAANILAEMSMRLRKADAIIGNLALLDVYGRVARLLIDLAKTEGDATDEGVVITSRPTQQDIASMIGTSRETVSRVLSEFQRRGFLQMQGKKILLAHGFAEREVFDQED
ncbi:MAG: Crp/Fnr family transcriptional regulator [Clostridia bacterium]|nr:Crp/Fnr family transcriptional regulator [Deltaproteobacteria bacterium]